MAMGHWWRAAFTKLIEHREASAFASAPDAVNLRIMQRNADRYTGILLVRRFLAQRLNAQLEQ